MNVLSKIVSFLAVFCVSQAADAALRAGGAATNSATSRVSVATPGTTSIASPRRMAVMTPTSTTAATSASLLAQTECVDSYTSCIKESNACGENFEECTTNELFYAQMPKCNSVLMQCSSAGISTLFGTSNTAYLSAEYANSYPAPGSVIGQYISAGEILNRLDTGKCVQRYTLCLNGSSVCGSDFELCTTNAEFKKQKVFCASTLARCQDEGKIELFGTTDTTQDPVADSRLNLLIVAGRDYAAAHAVDTCYKKADTCILRECKSNPLMCIDGTNKYLAELAGQINSNSTADPESAGDTIRKTDIETRLKKLCADDIGGSSECHMVANNKTTPPSKKDLVDEYNRGIVLDTIYNLRTNFVSEKIAAEYDEFNNTAKDTCAETLKSCVVRTCGDGVMPVCYQKAFKTNDQPLSVSNNETRETIKTGCEYIVNSDASCQYIAAKAKNIGDYTPDKTFDILFPEWTAKSSKDPIGVINLLNADLQAIYSDAAIAQMEKNCKQDVVDCVRSKCGSDFAKCYRNRSDIMGDTYNTSGSGNSDAVASSVARKFDASMNKVSGILDFTIIRGLCENEVQNSSACEQHLQIQRAKNSSGLKTKLQTSFGVQQTQTNAK
ncbi:MAG: hypothetical protein J5611_03520 [Alphaproteobacteria bacterium]|nr:hypothetical protein [Alphaproteobacteria bacterium]